MTLIIANVIWPSLIIESYLLSIWIILAGLLIEYLFVWQITDLDAVGAIWADLAMNAASTLLGILLIPVSGFIVAVFPGQLVGAFHPVVWGLSLLLAAYLNTWVETMVLGKWFKQNRKKMFWWLFLANAISVGVAFGSLLIYPPKV